MNGNKPSARVSIRANSNPPCKNAGSNRTARRHLHLRLKSAVWFSHAVMVAWADPVKAKFAWVGIVLSIGIVLATSWPAFAKRFGRKG